MRDNTAAITASPEFSLIQGADGRQWGKLRFSSSSHALQFSKTHAHTNNEASWGERSEWIGLNTQTASDFWNTGIAQHSKTLTMQESAKLSDRPSRPGEFRAAVTGGFWDTPSVIAGLPLAARMRQKTKLPPKQIKIAMFMSCGVDSADMAKITAKIAHALWQYTIAGGAVTLDMIYCGLITSSTGAKGLAVDTRINASDVAALSAVLSPVWFRGVTGRLMTATSESRSDPIYGVRENPIPGALWIGGPLEEAIKAGEAVLRELKLAP